MSVAKEFAEVLKKRADLSTVVRLTDDEAYLLSGFLLGQDDRVNSLDVLAQKNMEYRRALAEIAQGLPYSDRHSTIARKALGYDQ